MAMGYPGPRRCPAGNARGVRRVGSEAFRLCCAALLVTVWLCAGCTSPREYVQNGFKVGPNYRRPPAPVAEQWIDTSNPHVKNDLQETVDWWTIFNDPALTELEQLAFRQNLNVRQAGFRVLEARAQRCIAVGNFFPQQQVAQGDFAQTTLSQNDANRSFLPTRNYPQWDLGFSLAWELDFWGQFRRAIESADDNLNASIEAYDYVLVTLMGDIATTYTQARTFEQELDYVRANVKIQKETLDIANARYKGGNTTQLDVEQAITNLAQTEAQVPQLETQRRQAYNQLCILLGIPPEDLEARLGKAPIPVAPPDVAVGIPAQLLQRRPDVRQQERLAAAQAAMIGIAEADFYPAISITGTLGYSAQQFSDLFRRSSFEGTVGPSFQWKILNYGRILGNVRLQKATFEQLVANYQQTVLQADQQVENGIVQFLQAQEQTRYLATSVKASENAVTLGLIQYKGGTVDFNRVAVLEQNLVAQQNLYAQAQSAIALGAIQIYQSLGGGWQIRLGSSNGAVSNDPTSNVAPAPIPTPAPEKAAPKPVVVPTTSVQIDTTAPRPIRASFQTFRE